MPALALIARSDCAFAEALLQALNRTGAGHESQLVDLRNPAFLADTDEAETTYVYLASAADQNGMTPDLSEAEEVLRQIAELQAKQFVLISSALIYGTGPGRQSLVTEDHGTGSDSIARQWRTLEEMAHRHLRGRMRLTILRPTTVLRSSALLSRRLMARVTLTLAGHDPVLQLLSLADLANAILCAAGSDREGTFNVAPDGVIPLRAAVRIAGGRSLALPRTLQRAGSRSQALEYLRYPWTVSNVKIKQELGFLPERSSLTALMEARNRRPSATAPEPRFDDFGMDKDYIQSRGRTLFRFLCNHYWRIEAHGLENVPSSGRGVLVGMHRGFMPWDAVMTLHLLVRETGRYPRFLTHPGLMKYPFIARFITRLGGVVACQESADRLLESDELLGIFPEGVEGAFTLYRNAHRLQGFGRHTFVKLALRHHAPVIPYVIVGSAEARPMFARIKSRRWTRLSDWPYLPISTFPLLPAPLPTKWHIQFLPAIHLDQQYSERSNRHVKAISHDVRSRMQEAVDEMIRRRRSIFFGSIFVKE
ncbi:MAG: 1-acyl-sn-glycerol-3-phosphate acyltransferase [Acidobacteriia bacterium]|nr:1-acyl-sn-glycerol-3-phosphate acyltransferase [Terriglobia bacterium]